MSAVRVAAGRTPVMAAIGTLRLGCDLCQITAVEQMLTDDQAALDRLFHPQEQAYAMAQAHPAQHLAGIFAAKEALAKAVREPRLLGAYYRGAIISHTSEGAPQILLSEDLAAALARAGIQVLDLSISHDGEYAMAAALVEVIGRIDQASPRQAESPDGLSCAKCQMTLKSLSERNLAEVLIKAEDKEGRPQYLCPICLRGW
jgi:phosphopantetheine--protein transferase-like protein